ncbi:unnamed protein product [Prorocentrum cordatum]|uniref:CUE domain-containing protein n=1 Tax=Prorocentrum cordatum TaxID=2364126 RepID=A0ABN9UEU9_9DINO|nr:unnamed protein product [Polarella glacialis]
MPPRSTTSPHARGPLWLLAHSGVTGLAAQPTRWARGAGHWRSGQRGGDAEVGTAERGGRETAASAVVGVVVSALLLALVLPRVVLQRRRRTGASVGSLSDGSEHHFRAAALELTRHLFPEAAKHLATVHLVDVVAVRPDELRSLVRRTPERHENQRGEITTAGGVPVPLRPHHGRRSDEAQSGDQVGRRGKQFERGVRESVERRGNPERREGTGEQWAHGAAPRPESAHRTWRPAARRAQKSSPRPAKPQGGLYSRRTPAPAATEAALAQAAREGRREPPPAHQYQSPLEGRQQRSAPRTRCWRARLACEVDGHPLWTLPPEGAAGRKRSPSVACGRRSRAAVADQPWENARSGPWPGGPSN